MISIIFFLLQVFLLKSSEWNIKLQLFFHDRYAQRLTWFLANERVSLKCIFFCKESFHWSVCVQSADTFVYIWFLMDVDVVYTRSVHVFVVCYVGYCFAVRFSYCY